ncbi:L-rhamnono-gamma-lactonase [Knufia peltigerae]|uniref:L-rhamnono-gamma-lactonase n=1 Tax=Knufia peltigerae TaxID=1002370 RepID=A0AA38YEB3_9EURO|nr:L-rhamnono-gamma-lactonase [Knufia peltigerae]
MTSQKAAANDFPKIDSHIHLYAASHIPSLRWTGGLDEQHVLNRQCSVEEYKLATQHDNTVQGFVFLETDRKSDLGQDHWQNALDEVDFLVRVAKGTPRDGEGHQSVDAKLVLAIIPWAPVAAGERLLATYVDRVRQQCGEEFDLVKGFRYLLQDKPSGTMLQHHLIEGLQWLGKNDFTFDLGVDARSGGLHQLEEACEMMDRVYEEDSGLKIIINHFCKPNLRLAPDEAFAGHSEFIKWKQCIERMARHRSAYMKLSGFFSELPPQTSDMPSNISIIAEHMKPWVDVVFAAFTPRRIMFGSDWPVCNVGGPSIKSSWPHWRAVVEAILESEGLDVEEKAMIWSGTATEAYGIRPTLSGL